MSRGTKLLPPLQVGAPVAIQDQSGNTPRRWSKTGKVLESLGHDSYLVKVDGAGRTTKRNRQFLKLITPYATDVENPVTPWAPVNTAPTVDQVDPVDIPVPGLELPDMPDSGFSPVATAPLPPTAPVVPVPQTTANHAPVHDPGHDQATHTPAQAPARHTPYAVPVQPHHQLPLPPHAVQLTPPPPGVNHYETLRKIEAEARRQVEASRTLSAYLASMTNSALSSSVWGGINSYQPEVSPNPTHQLYQPGVFPNPTYQPMFSGQPAWALPNQLYQYGAGGQLYQQ